MNSWAGGDQYSDVHRVAAERCLRSSHFFTRKKCVSNGHTNAYSFIKKRDCRTSITAIFTALHGMQTRSCDEIFVRLSVRPSSVCLSNACIVTKRKKAMFRFFISYERTFILVFWEGEWLVGGDPFDLKFWVNRPALERNRRFWTDNRS